MPIPENTILQVSSNFNDLINVTTENTRNIEININDVT